MFLRSLKLVMLVLGVVFVSSFVSQMIVSASLPSSYDKGVKIDTAFATATSPLLIEFYSDACTTCGRMAPIVHDLMEDEFDDKLTLVMMDVQDEGNFQISEMFGLKELPGIYIFDFKNMKKHQIKSDHFVSKGTLREEMKKILADIDYEKYKTPGFTPPMMRQAPTVEELKQREETSS